MGEPTQPPPPTYLIRAFDAAGRWGVPVAMGGAYILLMVTSETNRTGRFWMAVGFLLVMIVWFTFRRLADNAGLSRAVFVGDTAKLFTLTAAELHRRHAKPSAIPYLVARAFAFELTAEPEKALEILAGLTPALAWQPLATVTTIAALLDLGRPAEARAVYDAATFAPSAPPGLATLAEGLATGNHALLARVASDIRAGHAAHTLAKRY